MKKLRYRLFTLTVLVLILVTGFLFLARTRHGIANEDLRGALKQYNIDSVEIIGIPDDISTQVAVGPNQLETEYGKKIEVRKMALLGMQRDLDEALSTTQCTAEIGDTEVRTAVIFFGKQHARLRAFYYGVDGSSGRLDHRSCRLSSGLYHWARKQLQFD